MYTDVSKLNYLDDLNLSINDYVIGASAAMVAHRLIDKNEDIDMLINFNAISRLVFEKKLKMIVKKIPFNRYHITYIDKSDSIDANYTLSNITPDVPDSYWFNESVLINNHRYMSIPQLKVFYNALWNKYKMPKHKIRIDILNKS